MFIDKSFYSSDALGHVLYEDVFATEPHPPFPASIKDGYAVIGTHILFVLSNSFENLIIEGLQILRLNSKPCHIGSRRFHVYTGQLETVFRFFILGTPLPLLLQIAPWNTSNFLLAISAHAWY